MSRSAVTPSGQRIRLHSGQCINVLQWRSGECGRPAMLLVHGFGDNAWIWQGVAPPLAEEFDVVAADLRGHGQSDWGGGDSYKLQAMASDLIQLMHRLSLDEAVLVGHSLGGAVATLAACTAPARFPSLVLVDYSPAMFAPGHSLAHIALVNAYRPYAGSAEYRELLARRHPFAAGSLVESLAEKLLRSTDEGYFPAYDPALLALAASSPLATSEELWRLHRELTMPTLIARGAFSWLVTVQDAKCMAHCHPGAQFTVIPKSAHSIHVDNPEELLLAIQRFCRHRVSGRQAA